MAQSDVGEDAKEGGGGPAPWIKGPFPYQDPTKLTTEAVDRLDHQLTNRIKLIQELLECKIANFAGLDEQRFAAIQEIFTARSTALDAALSSAKAVTDENRKVHEERFSSVRASVEALKEGIQRQLEERDTRTDQSRAADKIAIDAAFLAQKAAADAKDESNAEASAKSEGSFTKQIDLILGQLTNFRAEVVNKQASDKADLDRRLNELKERLDRGEGASRGVSETRTESHQSIGMIVGVIGGIVGFIGMIAAVITLVVSLSHSPSPSAFGASSYNAPQLQWPTAVPTAPGTTPSNGH